MTPDRRTLPVLSMLMLVLIGLGVLRILIDRPPDGGLQLAWPEPEWMRYRVNAVLVSIVVGAALGLAGLLLQTLLRNPLASPYILGLSSGAGLGVTVAAWLASIGVLTAAGTGSGIAGQLTSFGVTTLPALIGAGAVLGIVYLFGQRRGWIDPLSLVLVGVVISAMCSALIMFVQHLAPGGVIQDVIRWMFGRIPQGISPPALAAAAGVTGIAIVLSLLLAHALDASLLGDEEARSVGVSLGPVRLAAFVLAGVLTAVAVAVAGPIGFVGIIAPHTARLLTGERHFILSIGTVLCGSMLLVIADIASQAIYLESGRLPVGIFTALAGGPVFIWLLRSRGGRLGVRRGGGS